MNVREIHLRGWVLLAIGICAAGLAMLVPGRANADLVDAKLTACHLSAGGWCREIGQITPGETFGINIDLTVGKLLGGGSRIYVKGPDTTVFSPVSQWVLRLSNHNGYEQRPYEVLDDGRIIRAEIGPSLYPALGHNETATANFAEVSDMTKVGNIDSFRVAVWTDLDEVPMMTNSVKVGSGNSGTRDDLRTKNVAGPSGKTGSKRVEFRFRSDDAYSFGCKLDDGKWRTCSSPKRLRVSKGKHTFLVRAVGVTGKLGPIVKRRFTGV
ncbi:MAG: hypothetical protein ACSLFD_03930 [Solirubrobacterales bacterium]